MKPEVKTWKNDSGLIEEERHYLNGKLHREDGPAIIYYDEDGKPFGEAWYLNGIPLSIGQIAKRQKNSKHKQNR